MQKSYGLLFVFSLLISVSAYGVVTINERFVSGETSDQLRAYLDRMIKKGAVIKFTSPTVKVEVAKKLNMTEQELDVLVKKASPASNFTDSGTSTVSKAAESLNLVNRSSEKKDISPVAAIERVVETGVVPAKKVVMHDAATVTDLAVMPKVVEPQKDDRQIVAAQKNAVWDMKKLIDTMTDEVLSFEVKQFNAGQKTLDMSTEMSEFMQKNVALIAETKKVQELLQAQEESYKEIWHMLEAVEALPNTQEQMKQFGAVIQQADALTVGIEQTKATLAEFFGVDSMEEVLTELMAAKLIVQAMQKVTNYIKGSFSAIEKSMNEPYSQSQAMEGKAVLGVEKALLAVKDSAEFRLQVLRDLQVTSS